MAIDQLRATIDQIRAIPDPAARVRAINAAIDQHKAAISELAQITRDTVAELRANGASHAQVAELLGVTRARAQQLASGPT